MAERQDMERDALSFDPFGGDKEGFDRRLSDRIVTARKTRTCRECGGTIMPGERIRSFAAVDDGKVFRAEWCGPCVEAQARSWADGGEAVEFRCHLGMALRDDSQAQFALQHLAREARHG